MGKTTTRLGGSAFSESTIVTRSASAKAAASTPPHWLVLLPPEVLYYQIILPHLPPETYYAVLPLVSRAFAREFSAERIPVSISVLTTSKAHPSPNRGTTRGKENTFEFTIGPLSERSDCNVGGGTRYPRSTRRKDTTKPGLYIGDISISFLPSFRGDVPEDKEVNRQSEIAPVRTKTATRGKEQILDHLALRRRRAWFGVSATVRIYSHHNPHLVTPPDHQSTKIATLTLNSVEKHMRRSVLGLFHSLEVEYADSTFALSLESLARTINPQQLILPSPVLEDIRWEGTRLSNVKTLRLTHQNAADCDVDVGLDLGLGGDGDWAARKGLGNGGKNLKVLKVAAGSKSELYEAFGTVFYVPERFATIAGGEAVEGMPDYESSDSSFPRLRRLALAMPPDGVRDRWGNPRFPTMTLKEWKGLGDALKRLTPGLVELHLTKVDVDLFLREGDPDARKGVAVPGHLAKVVETVLGAVAGGKPGAAKRGCGRLEKVCIGVKTWEWWRGDEIQLEVKKEAALKVEARARKFGVAASTEFH
ncbi:hypothetical protein HDU93_003290 [Gonapodya sp. JEL0774]|nr:hypothetical protein HDU93_003290 [Gonapodya sp. JEL0774]